MSTEIIPEQREQEAIDLLKERTEELRREREIAALPWVFGENVQKRKEFVVSRDELVRMTDQEFFTLIHTR